MSRIWSQRRGRTTVWLATALVLLCAVAWLAADPHTEESVLTDSLVEAPLDGGDGDVLNGQVPMVVTIRWGNMSLSPLDAQTTATEEAVLWDGYLAVDCGSIERAVPLGFEIADPGKAEPITATDFMGQVKEGAGERRVSWRSRVRRGWDGLRAHIRACTTSTDGRQQRSNLLVYTAQRTYRARLDWSGNDFVSLRTPGSSHRLEVHIDAKLDARGLEGARITATPTPQRELAQLDTPNSTTH